MRCRIILLVLLAGWHGAAVSQTADTPLSGVKQAAIPTPNVLAAGWKIEPVAAEPNLVTPTDCVLDESGLEALASDDAFMRQAAIAGSTRDPASEQRLIEIIADLDRPATTRAFAVHLLSEQANQPTAKQLTRWVVEQNSRPLSLEIIRLLAARQTEVASDGLAVLAADENLDDQTRADALAGLARNAGSYAAIINKLSLPRQSTTLRTEANRILNRPVLESDQISSSAPAGPQQIPGKEDIQQWDELVGHGGDVDAGRRVFMRKTCIKCHAHSGRGARTGPDLSSLPGQMTSRRIIESILTPSREIDPKYVPWRILTVDGQVLTGLKLHAPGVANSLRFQGADGNTFDVRLADIETQEPIEQSIMPSGLEQVMSLPEFRDLIAFLTQGYAK